MSSSTYAASSKTWTMISLGAAAAVLGAWGTLAWGQQAPSVLPGAPTGAAAVAADSELLGQKFESRAAGISLRAPASCDEIRRGGLDTIVEFVNEQRGWVMTVSKVGLQHPRPLKDYTDERGHKQVGILSATLEDFSRQHSDAEVLRKDIITIADGDVGVFALRFFQGKKRRLLQQAMVRQSDSLYYVVTLASNASLDKGIPDDPAKVNADERLAASVFSQVLDTVRILDRTSIRKEQEDRLQHAREILPSLKTAEAMKKAMKAEQYYRLVRDGKEMGYTCIYEEVARRDGREGILVSMRAKTAVDKSTADVLSQMFVSFGWRNESWSHVAKTAMEKRTSQTSELGVSNLTSRAVVDRTAPTTQVGEHYQPPVVEVEDYNLEVRTTMQRTTEKGPLSATAQPKTHPLPPWYVPQAARQMLPRLLPAGKPELYLFATYISEQREVMARYVDVGSPATVNFAGKRQTVTPIYDRTGLEGAVTIHYLSPEGEYLGSTTTYTGVKPSETMTIEVIATDAATLQRNWPGADLSKPKESDLGRVK